MLAIAVAVALVALVSYALSGRSAERQAGAGPVADLEARVRTEPPGLAVELDGRALDSAVVRFAAAPPFGTLRVRSDCRVAEHALGPADAGTEVVLVPDPRELDWPLEADVAGAVARLNGEKLGAVPLELRLDLCRENRIEIEAPNHRPASVVLPAAATPLEARSRLAGLALEPLPLGRLALASIDVPVTYFVDGKRVGKPPLELELTEGPHVVRWTNAELWLDEVTEVQVVAGATARFAARSPGIARLVVQSYPPSCQVFLRRPGGKWARLDETPFERRLAAGRYEVRVQRVEGGETREVEVRLAAGENPPVRVAFGGAG